MYKSLHYSATRHAMSIEGNFRNSRCVSTGWGTPLVVASEQGHTATVEALLAHGVDIESTSVTIHACRCL